MAADQLTEDILNAIEDAVANGATTNLEIAKSLGWKLAKYESWKYGKRKNGEDESTRISKAIKKGEKRQLNYFLKLAEKSHVKLLTGYHEEETKTEVSDLKGNTTVTTKKYYPPNPTIVMFTEVNAGKGKWKSINNAEQKEQNITINLPKGAELVPNE